MTVGAIDLGSTYIKVARLNDRGGVQLIARIPAPRPKGRGPIRESDAQAWQEAAYEALRVARAEGVRDLGLSVQRSSFAIWRNSDSKPQSPLISWQDTRAREWCSQHANRSDFVRERTGLPLSPHYVGPKIAAIRASKPTSLNTMDGGGSFLGTLDTAVIHRWSQGQQFVTAPCIAARTLLLDPERRLWDPELLALFRVPRPALASVLTPDDLPLFVAGVHIRAVVSDQSAAFLAVAQQFPKYPMINAGTGTFVLLAHSEDPPEGYLRSAMWECLRGPQWCWEGTINAGSTVFHELARISTSPKSFDVTRLHSPETPAFGTPYFGRPNKLLPQSTPKNRAIAYAFRIRQILEDMGVSDEVPVVLGGGCARMVSAVQGLADTLGRSVLRLTEPDLSALGAATQATSDESESTNLQNQQLDPRNRTFWNDTYSDWHDWFTHT